MNKQKTLLLVAGYAGTGKTMTGKIIAAKLQAPYIDKDTVARPILEKALTMLGGNPDDRESELYVKHFKDEEYVATMNIAWENLRFSQNVVVVAPFISSFSNEEWVAALEQKAKRMNVRYHILWVHSSPESMRKLLLARKTTRDNWKLNHWEEYSASIAKPPELPKNHTIIKNDARDLRMLEKDLDNFLESMDIIPKE